MSLYTSEHYNQDIMVLDAILRTCCEDHESVQPSPGWKCARGRPPTTWIHQIHRDTGIPVTDALELAADRSFLWQITMAGCYSESLRVINEWMSFHSWASIGGISETLLCRHDINILGIISIFYDSLSAQYGLRFCHAPLGVRSAKRRHQSPEWTILSHVSCFIQGEVVGFQVLHHDRMTEWCVNDTSCHWPIDECQYVQHRSDVRVIMSIGFLEVIESLSAERYCHLVAALWRVLHNKVVKCPQANRNLISRADRYAASATCRLRSEPCHTAVITTNNNDN